VCIPVLHGFTTVVCVPLGLVWQLRRSEGMATPLQYAHSSQKNCCADIILQRRAAGLSSGSLQTKAAAKMSAAGSKVCVVS